MLRELLVDTLAGLQKILAEDVVSDEELAQADQLLERLTPALCESPQGPLRSSVLERRSCYGDNNSYRP